MVSTPETPARADAEWAQFVQTLGEQLAALWPAMPARLGDRYGAFVDHAVQQAAQLGFVRAAAVARYVNLWFVWGSGFQNKPGFEWAAALLAAARLREWNTVHQLVQRSLQELARVPDARVNPAALAAADAHLLDHFAALGSRGALFTSEPDPAPRAACDLQAVELRVLELAVAAAYEWQAGSWQRVPLAETAPLRVHAAQPLPPLVALLSLAPGAAVQTRLQARLSTLAVCSAGGHPELRLAGSHGLWRWRGAETRACSWPLATLAQPGPAAGPGTAVAEETSPDVLQLSFNTCGLRDDGEPLGSLQTQLWVWPAEQWWLQLQRQPAAAQPLWATQAPTVRPQTRFKLEQDGAAQPVSALTVGFEAGLDQATAQALQALQSAWQRVPGLAAEPGEGVLALLVGQAALTWGWRLGPGGMNDRACMRLVADLQLQAVLADWLLQGELTLAPLFSPASTSASARARLVLRCHGQAALAGTVRREATPLMLAVSLSELLPQVQCRFRLPLQAELTPLASDSAAILQAAGPVTGALVGDAGLRPRSRGGSGLEGLAVLRLEAVELPVQSIDPLLGEHSHRLPLLPAMVLLDWSLG